MEKNQESWGIDYCNECPFLCIHKKTKKMCCGPYEYVFNEIDYSVDNKIIVPNWCPNKKR